MSSVFRTWLVLGVLVLLLILANIYLFVPLMTEQAGPYVPPLQETDVAGKQSAYPDHESYIAAVPAKKTSAGSYMILVPEAADDRNPFFWPEERIKKEKVVIREVKTPAKKAERPVKEAPELNMIIVGVQSRKAMLDKTFVSEGDMFYGYRVKRIDQDKVVLSDQYGELSIKLGAGKEHGEMTPVPGGLIER